MNYYYSYITTSYGISLGTAELSDRLQLYRGQLYVILLNIASCNFISCCYSEGPYSCLLDEERFEIHEV